MANRILDYSTGAIIIQPTEEEKREADALKRIKDLELEVDILKKQLKLIIDTFIGGDFNDK